jgi:hypothetical protein
MTIALHYNCPAQSDSKVDIVGHDSGDGFLLKICELAFENLLDSAMDTCWVQGVNNLMRYGRWAFAEVFQIESDFKAKVETHFNAI